MSGLKVTDSECEKDVAAVEDILSVLPEPPDQSVAGREAWKPEVWIEVRGSFRPLDQEDVENFTRKQRLDEVLAALGSEDEPVAFGIMGNDLIVRVAPLIEGKTAFVARINDDAFTAFLAAHFPDLSLPGALRHLLRLHLVGIGLKESAERDGRSVETRKRQSQQLRAAFQIDDLATVGRQVSSALVLALDHYVAPKGPSISRTIQSYVSQFLPVGTRLIGLTTADGRTFPVIDMGPATGRPVLVLHPMALPDIRPTDISQMERLGLRLIWPLRHGTCSPGTKPLPHRQHLDHAVHGALLALGAMCGGYATVLAFAAASRVGLELAAKAPNAVEALHVAGVCLREGRPESGPRRLAKGVLALAARNPGLLDPILVQIETHLRRPGVFEDFLRRQFADSPADLAIVAEDLAGPHGPDRFRTALLDSAASARHDFLFQRDLGWDRVPPDLALHLHHGAQDRIHPLGLIRDLATRLSGACLHVHPNTGQLFHHDHLTRVLERVAGVRA
ncbi:hypothetical protein ATO6_14680 [Oceanicola sp. 22II-s10i]|uniref:alpha/beta hydrolase n=1 Tax=Oceanicola sp. 22II-s10i TaxID=1317116 RepID=UPI000B5259F9|nr:alpha/beta hydrolase [Oceanicola sp. 22II-s10i]OWU84270.1 hypothetical protein ATO6_14680 [Oceanicola sp. 22II-s10i]